MISQARVMPTDIFVPDVDKKYPSKTRERYLSPAELKRLNEILIEADE